MTITLEVMLRGDQTVHAEQVNCEGDPRTWTPADMQAILRRLLASIDAFLNPGEEPRPIELRGLNWIVSPYQGQVVIAFEIASASAVAGPFDVPQDVLESLLNRSVVADYRTH